MVSVTFVEKNNYCNNDDNFWYLIVYPMIDRYNYSDRSYCSLFHTQFATLDISRELNSVAVIGVRGYPQNAYCTVEGHP